MGHSRSDPGKYRPPGELEAWRERDPLRVARARLADEYGVEEATLVDIEAGVERELDQVVERALAAPFPDPAAPVSEFKGA